MVDVRCPRCSKPIPAGDVDSEGRSARCASCNTVFYISQRREASRLRVAPVPMPDGITVVEDSEGEAEESGYRERPGAAGGRLVITRSWYSPALYFFVFFCIFWNGFLVFWYKTAAQGGGPVAFTVLAMLFPALHVAVGVGLTYFTIASFVNKTWITADRDAITVRHAPLPWIGNHTIPARAVVQLYCEEVVTSGKHGPSTSYNLACMLAKEKKVLLLRWLPRPDQALFVEQRIEEKLAIANAKVDGEYEK